MASIITKKNGTRMIGIVFGPDDRKYVRLGKIAMRQAATILLYVEDLVTAKLSHQSPRNDTAEWVGQLGESLRSRLERVGLVEPSQQMEQFTVAGWVRQYIDGRADVKPNTRRNYDLGNKAMREYFGSRRLDEVTAADAEGFRVFLGKKKSEGGKGYSEVTTRRLAKLAKQFFEGAVSAELLIKNPFRRVKCGNLANSSRQRFISPEDAQAVVEACPDAEWRLLFALARYGGLRCPSEILNLKWADIDWARDRFTVHAPKTERSNGGTRQVPIFPELYPHLRDCFEQAEPGTEYVITRYRATNQNLRTQLARIVRKAGLIPWPKLWQNLRSTRETELFNQGVDVLTVCSWIGNSPLVAMKHYRQTRDEDFRRAAGKAHQKAHQYTAVSSEQTRTDAKSEKSDGSENPNVCGPIRTDAQLCAMAQGQGDYSWVDDFRTAAVGLPAAHELVQALQAIP